jgi:hypothetical protein
MEGVNKEMSDIASQLIKIEKDNEELKSKVNSLQIENFNLKIDNLHFKKAFETLEKEKIYMRTRIGSLEDKVGVFYPIFPDDNGEYEIINGLTGMKRDIILKLIMKISSDDKIRNVCFFNV